MKFYRAALTTKAIEAVADYGAFLAKLLRIAVTERVGAYVQA
jgi:hypothetical protein